MSGCAEGARSMRSTRSNVREDTEDCQSLQKHYRHLRQRMTRVLSAGHPVQLTLLWEHVVRTRRFPAKVDSQSIFHEILERLRYPEWQVRQHALRVLVDVLPTLNVEKIDENMQPVVPELVRNLGHSAPAVRKGSLDALRIYLLHSRDRDNMLKNIIYTELNRTDVLDEFQSNVKLGVILSTPLLLFPSKNSEGPSREILQEIALALAARLIDVTYQKAVLRSLIKIREAVGRNEFDSYFDAVDSEVKLNFEALCDSCHRVSEDVAIVEAANEENLSKHESGSSTPLEHNWENGNSTGATEVDKEPLSAALPSARVVLETEIKFNEETAITMTILEEKNANRNNSPNEIETDESEQREQLIPSEESRKTPRRVHFGGEEIKLRTPESDDAESCIREIPRSRIPLPVSPATQMPRRRRTFLANGRTFGGGRCSSTFVGQKKAEAHVHNGSLSPKKSILARTTSPVRDSESRKTRNKVDSCVQNVQKRSIEEAKYENRNAQKVQENGGRDLPREPFAESFQVFQRSGCEQIAPRKSIDENWDFLKHSQEKNEDEINAWRSQSRCRSISPVITEDGFQVGVKKESKLSNARSRSAEKKTYKSDMRSTDHGSSRSRSYDFNVNPVSYRNTEKDINLEVLPCQEKNCVVMELSSPTKRYFERQMYCDDGKVNQSTVLWNNVITGEAQKSPKQHRVLK